MRRVQQDDLRRLAEQIFEHCGATSAEAETVSRELVKTSLMGVDSHGISSINQYVNEVERGIVRPGAPLKVIRDRGSSMVVDCGFNFGIFQAMEAVTHLADRVREHGIACVVGERSHHIGRLGTYVQYLAEQGLIGLGYACGSVKFGKKGIVAPFGGKEGRFSTNPLAYAVPKKDGLLLFDVTTAAIPQQKLKILRLTGDPAPAFTIIDKDGADTQDPAAVLEEGGAILPFGGTAAHKGYGLAILAEVLGGFLSGNLYVETEYPDGQYSNSFAFIGIDPDAFCGSQVFRDLIEDYGVFIKSSEPRFSDRPVLLPGEVEMRTFKDRSKDGIPVSDAEWDLLMETAESLGISVE